MVKVVGYKEHFGGLTEVIDCHPDDIECPACGAGDYDMPYAATYANMLFRTDPFEVKPFFLKCKCCANCFIWEATFASFMPVDLVNALDDNFHKRKGSSRWR